MVGSLRAGLEAGTPQGLPASSFPGWAGAGDLSFRYVAGN